MAEICKVQWLCMQNGMELQISRTHLIMMHRQMGIELTRHALELTIPGGEHPATLPAGFDHNAGEVGCRHLEDIAQPSAGSADDERRAGQIWHRARQLDDLRI